MIFTKCINWYRYLNYFIKLSYKLRLRILFDNQTYKELNLISSVLKNIIYLLPSCIAFTISANLDIFNILAVNLFIFPICPSIIRFVKASVLVWCYSKKILIYRAQKIRITVNQLNLFEYFMCSCLQSLIFAPFKINISLQTHWKRLITCLQKKSQIVYVTGDLSEIQETW